MTTKSVLIIDGNDKERQYYADKLVDEYVIYLSETGQTGLECFDSNAIDCVILELDLPDTSGFEILLKLVPLASQPTVPVIILTRLPNPMLVELAIKNGARAALYKSRASGDSLRIAVSKAIAAVPTSVKESNGKLDTYGIIESELRQVDET